MTCEYGTFSDDQILSTKERLRKKIFHLLLFVDPGTSWKYPEVNVEDAIKDVLYVIGGLNDLFGRPQEIISALGLLDRALMEYRSPDFDFQVYRKLILDAGHEVGKLEEVM